jgi:CubicO group peptidase (beta-lactamase class C family)
MVDTAYFVPEAKMERLPTLYVVSESGGMERADHRQLEEYVEPFPLFSASSGLLSTAADYLRFMQMMLNRGELDGARLLGSRTVDYMMRNHLGDHLLPYELSTPLTGYGFGLGGYVIMDAALAQQLESEGNYGWGGAFGTQFWIDPREKITGIILTQLKPVLFYPLEAKLKTVTYQALL